MEKCLQNGKENKVNTMILESAREAPGKPAWLRVVSVLGEWPAYDEYVNYGFWLLDAKELSQKLDIREALDSGRDFRLTLFGCSIKYADHSSALGPRPRLHYDRHEIEYLFSFNNVDADGERPFAREQDPPEDIPWFVEWGRGKRDD